MFDTLPHHYDEFKDWQWENFEPYYANLLERDLSADTAEAWLADLTAVQRRQWEMYVRLDVAKSQDTTDKDVEKRFNNYLEQMLPPFMETREKLSRKIVAADIDIPDFDIPLRRMKSEIELFRMENLPLLPKDQKLGSEYDAISGAQTIEWEGEEITLEQIQPILQEQDREKREKAWRLAHERRLQDREQINDLWKQMLELRIQIATNADEPNYLSYGWKSRGRFDYTPEDAQTFHKAVEDVVVPAAIRIHEKRRERLGVETLRPWDLSVDTSGKAPLRPYQSVDDLNSKMSNIFHKVDPKLGGYYDEMIAEGLLDLENRKGKAPGGYNTAFRLQEKPFIFMNAVGIHDDIQTLLHEGGHAFHVYETVPLKYLEQKRYPTEFAEVASMAMELLAAPYLSASEGGFYSDSDAARARIEHLEGILTLWPYIVVMDAFQHWAYTHPVEAANTDNLDAKWGELWDRFMKGVDWSSLEDIRVTGWQRKLHIFRVPLYYIEYGLAQLGAVQVYSNALKDQAQAIAQYRQALALGGTRTIPDLFAAAGAKFAFDADTMQTAVDLCEKLIAELETQI